LRRSTFISSAIHIAILLWSVAVFPSARPEQTIQDIAVDIVSPSELTKLKAGMTDAKDDAPLARQEEPKPKPVPAPPKPEEVTPAAPPPPPPQAKPEEQTKPKEAEKPKEPEPKKEPPKEAKAKPEPKKELPKEAEAKPEPKPAEAAKKPEAKPEPKVAEKEPEPKKRPEKKKAESKPRPKPSLKAETKRDFNTDRISALLNKMPDAGSEPQTEEHVPEEPRRPVRGQSNGTQLTMSINEIDALRARIAQCWNPPPGGLGADAIIVKLRLRLNEDGSLVGYPTVANIGSSPFFQAAADSAVRAVFQCQPYSLPSEKYAVWRDMILTFDPRQMYGSG
jgi:hypothetical protein